MQIKTLNIEHPLFVEGTTLDVGLITVIFNKHEATKKVISDYFTEMSIYDSSRDCIHKHIRYFIYDNLEDFEMSIDEALEVITTGAVMYNNPSVICTCSKEILRNLVTMVREGKLHTDNISFNFAMRYHNNNLADSLFGIKKISLKYFI